MEKKRERRKRNVPKRNEDKEKREGGEGRQRECGNGSSRSWTRTEVFAPRRRLVCLFLSQAGHDFPIQNRAVGAADSAYPLHSDWWSFCRCLSS